MKSTNLDRSRSTSPPSPQSKEPMNIFSIDYLNYINSKRSKNYDSILSKICLSVSIAEKDQYENLSDEQISLLKDVYNKLTSNNNNPNKEKKKKNNKNNRGNKDGMGLLLSLDVKEPLILYNAYKEVIKKDIPNYECYLYSINISENEKLNNHGFIFPINIGQIFRIKLVDRKNRKIIYADISKEKKIYIDSELMENVIIYHYYICCHLLRGKKNIEIENVKNFVKNLKSSEIYKKYFFVPIIKEKGVKTLNEKKILKCKNFIQEKSPYDIFQRVGEIISFNTSKKNGKEEIRKKVLSLFQDTYFITDYKMNRIYKYEDLIFKDDKFSEFIEKFTFGKESLKEQVEAYLITVLSDNYIKTDDVVAKNIMEDLVYDEEDYNPKSFLGGIIGYRQIPQKYNIELSNKYNYYLSCKFGTLKTSNRVNYLYNTNILKSNYVINPPQTNKIEPPPAESVDNYAKILPPDRVICYFLDNEDVELFEIIPSIFLNFEEYLKIPQFLKDYKILNKKSKKEKDAIEKNYPFIQWAFTLHSYLQDFNYESLETLGDSILKMLATILVYHVHEINDIETDVGELVFNRATLICNIHLYDKGLKNKIYTYLIKYPKELISYVFPLLTEFITSGTINITEKIIADIVESSIGGIFLTTRNTNDCFNYIKQIDIPFVEKNEEKYEQGRESYSKDKIWKSQISYENLVYKGYNIMDEKMKEFPKFLFPEKIEDLIQCEEPTQNITLLQLMEIYLLKCNKEKENFKGDINSLDYIQTCRLFYKFKDIKLLEQAMTHKSKTNINSKNYEKLELLGDSIVESFISQYTFCIFAPYLFQDPDIVYSNSNVNEKIIKNAKIFNNKYMTHVKSYLCSNYFMCKLSILIGLPKFIIFGENDVSNKNKLTKFLEYKNIKSFVESSLSSYASTETYQPKFVADLFEALIGAIYIDSDLKTTYEFLRLIYGPSICYSCLYLKDLPFSIVADFTERCSKEIKIVPSFKGMNKQEVESNGIEYDNNKYYMKLTIGDMFTCMEKGDNEETAKENLSEKGIAFLDQLKYDGPKKMEK